MATFSDNLATMRGEVLSVRPRISPLLVQTFLNNRIRAAIEARTFWADLLERRLIAIPDAYTTGTVSLTNGSRTVTGSAGAWTGKVSDVVNTTISAGVSDIGYVEVVPASMAGITADSVVYVDSAGTPEAIPVVEVGPASFWGKGFESPHNAACTLTQSSLVGRQFRISIEKPIFTIRAVHSATELELDMPWGEADLVASTYQIVQMYYSLGSDLKEIIVGVDPQTPWPLRLHTSIQEMDWRDPQRSTTSYGGPMELVDLGPSESGSMLYELWPVQSSARQLRFLIAKQWPELKKDTDRPPWFINPGVFVNGAIADALNVKIDAQDVWHNPQLAKTYEAKFTQGLHDAVQADDAKALRTLRWNHEQMGFMGGGADFAQSHDLASMAWDFS